MSREQNPAEYEPFDLRPDDVERCLPDDVAAAKIAFNLIYIRWVEGDLSIYARPTRDAEGHRRWNVWIHATWERVPLEQWIEQFRKDYDDLRRKQQGQNGGAL